MDRLVLRQAWAFVFREWHLTRRYFSWVVVFMFYSLVSSATVALIGVAAQDFRLTLNLVLGVLLWSFLSCMFSDIANSISYERWEGTLEYTFMAPVSRLVHLFGISLYAIFYAAILGIVIVFGLTLFMPLSFAGANLPGLLLVLVVGSMAFAGLGLMAAILPVMSPEHGAQATNIFQGVLLLISGVYYPVKVLPHWLQPFSTFSPATYALSASRKLIGVDNPLSTPTKLVSSPIREAIPELLILMVMGLVLIPLGLWVFNQAETWAKRTGKLKRTG
ncbi:MAG: ABC transporter permease [Armatimonadetes bacterium]|nr:ABC transporter permease [Armatimonadota bacterium]